MGRPPLLLLYEAYRGDMESAAARSRVAVARHIHQKTLPVEGDTVVTATGEPTERLGSQVRMLVENETGHKAESGAGGH